MTADFAHLHVHSEYSLLDGQSRIKRLIQATQAAGMDALALTDHGGMYGSIEFYKACRAAGVKPILGCLLAGQEILTANGVKNVEDVQVGDSVLTHRGRFRRVTKTMRRPYRGRAYTVALSGRYGRTLTLTEEHPILVRTRDGTMKWCKPGEIRAGRPASWSGGANEWLSWACLPKLATEYEAIDVTAFMPLDFRAIEGGGIARTYMSKYRADERWPDFPARIPLDFDFGYLLGIYAAEGNVINGGIVFTLHEDELDIAARIKEMAARWGFRTAVYPDKRSRGVGLRIFSRPLEYLMPALCGNGAHEKRVPAQVLNGPRSVRDGFLDGILDGDGRNPSAPSKRKGRCDFKTSSRSLAWGVRTLLADKGYWACVTSGEEHAILPSGNGERSEKAYRYYMLAYGPGRTFSYTLEDDHGTYRPISTVAALELDAEVFNFEVEEDNSYISDFVLHNCEGYLAPSIEEKTGRYEYNHLLLLAKNNTGYHNLLKLTTIAHTRGYHYRPRVDKKVLADYAEGLIVTSGCLSGEIPEMLLKGDLNGARAAVRWYQDVIGPENFYIEIQDHQALESPQNKLNPLLYDLHREMGAPLLATNDLHYVRAEDADAQDVLLCVQTGKTLDEPKRMKFDSQQYYLKTPSEMARLFPELPDALKNTVRVAEECNVEIQFGANLLPDYTIPPRYADQEEYLYYLCVEGVQERYGEMNDAIRQRLDYEIGIIRDKGLTSYFLIVWDYVSYARGHGMRCVARGSAAGSLVSYVLGITNVDPLRYALPFERFLNPERKGLPDIDMDFPDDRREEVIRYVANKYGWENVGQIVTFNTMAAKAAIRDVGRVMGMQSEADRVARLIPAGPKVTIDGSLDSVRDLKQVYEQSAQIRKLVDVAKDLEGTVRSTGIHAAGVIISREPLDTVIPLQLRDYKDPNDTWLVSQYEQAHLEDLGLIKFDFLGLSNLTILMNCKKFIKETRDSDIDLDRLPTDDAKTYALLGEGETTGVFQLESGAMRSYIKELKPTCIEDVMAMVALYRPGPMDSIPQFIKAKHGEIESKYLHPRLEPLLRESYGVIVYQDQVLLVAIELAGFSWGEVDKFRKAMSKKLATEMAKYRDMFVKGCVKNGIDEKVAGDIFSFIEPFAGYGFNKSHACAYAWVAYQTAYLKANYTAEFMAATLTTEASDAKKVVAAIDECRRMGVEVLPPDINASDIGFTVEKLAEADENGEPRWGVRFGLLAIKGVGSRPIEELLEARRSGGPFTSLVDLCARTDSKNLTRSAAECLVKAGALDAVGRPREVSPHSWRSRLIASLDRAFTLGQQQRKMREIGQNSLFGAVAHDPTSDFVPMDAPDYPRQQVLAWEKDLLNIYLSAHPLAHVAGILKKRVSTYTALLNEEWAGQKITLGGRVTDVRRIMTKKGDAMAAIQLEDTQGSIEVVVFPRVFAATSERWRTDAILLVTGTVSLRNDEPQLVADEVEEFVPTEEEMNRKEYLLRIRVARGGNDAIEIARVDQLLTALHRYPGDDRYELYVRNGRWVARLAPSSDQPGVKFCPELMQKIEEILGAGTVEAIPTRIGGQPAGAV